MRSALTQLLAIEHPLLLVPMSNISGRALAKAVSDAGGLGLIGGGYGDADWLRCEFDKGKRANEDRLTARLGWQA